MRPLFCFQKITLSMYLSGGKMIFVEFYKVFFVVQKHEKND